MKMRPEHEKKAVRVLSAVAPFSALSQQRLEQLVRSEGVALKEFSAGQQVFPCRSISDAMGVLLGGECRTLSDGKIVSVGHEGTLFDDGLMYYQKGTSVKAEAVKVCRVLFIGNNAINELIEENPDFSLSYRSLLSQIAEKHESQSSSLSTDKALLALAEYLLSRPRNSKGEVPLPRDMFRLAKQLELDKSSLFKAIEALNSSGAIALSGSSVCIKDEEKLKSFI